MQRSHRWLWTWVALTALVGCKGFGGEEVGAPDYATDAEMNLRLGDEARAAKNHADAEKYYEHVRSKFPFLEAAKEAELRLADNDFDRERYLEARDRYQNFVKLHPTHPKVDTAAFRAALTHYKEIPSDFFLLPPSREKDQGEVRQAVRGFTDFLRQYPESAHQAEAKSLLEEARRRLADHELYVAEFYKKREKWAAVAARLENVAQQYAGLGFDEQVLFGLHEAYTKMKDAPKAQDALERLIRRMPGTPAAERAQALLGG